MHCVPLVAASERAAVRDVEVKRRLGSRPLDLIVSAALEGNDVQALKLRDVIAREDFLERDAESVG